MSCTAAEQALANCHIGEHVTGADPGAPADVAACKAAFDEPRDGRDR